MPLHKKICFTFQALILSDCALLSSSSLRTLACAFLSSFSLNSSSFTAAWVKRSSFWALDRRDFSAWVKTKCNKWVREIVKILREKKYYHDGWLALFDRQAVQLLLILSRAKQKGHLYTLWVCRCSCLVNQKRAVFYWFEKNSQLLSNSF